MRIFRATYGWLGIDVTFPLLAHCKRTPDQLVAGNVDLALGANSVTLSIPNTSGKTASQTVNFSIGR